LEVLNFEFELGHRQLNRDVHVGVVASGNLEILLARTNGSRSCVRVRTATAGFMETWSAVLKLFFSRHDVAALIEINDGGASPPVVLLRLEQALEEALQ
jgi:malonate decarboxylase delta subunit